MEMSQLTKNLLIYSAVAFVIVALIFLSVVLFKVYKIKKTIKKDTLDILSQESVTDGHLKVIERADFGEPIFELRDAILNPLDDEIVEFSINFFNSSFSSCIFSLVSSVFSIFICYPSLFILQLK